MQHCLHQPSCTLHVTIPLWIQGHTAPWLQALLGCHQSQALPQGCSSLQLPALSVCRSGRCHALLPTGAGPVLTGSSDRCIRLWDAAYPQQSYIVAGPPAVDSAADSSSDPTTATSVQQPVSYKYWQHIVQQVSVVDEVCRPTVASMAGQSGTTVLSYPGRAFAQSHRDSVKCLLPLYVSEQLLLSASQDGIIKAWK